MITVGMFHFVWGLDLLSRARPCGDDLAEMRRWSTSVFEPMVDLGLEMSPLLLVTTA